MNDSPPQIAVVGSGLAAHVAARRLRAESVDPLHVGGDSLGIASIWNGLGSVYGPPSPMPPDSAGSVDRRGSYRPAFDPQRDRRWERLVDRRGDFHPYRRLDLALGDVTEQVDRAIDHLPGGLLEPVDDGSVFPGPHGAPAAPDLLFPSLGALDLEGGGRVGLLASPALSGWDAGSVAAQLDRAEGLEAIPLAVDLFDALPVSHGVRAAHWFQQRWAADADAIVERLGGLVDDAEIDRLVLPPMIGATMAAHAEIWSRLADDIDVPVAEYPPGADPVVGWRLRRAVCDADTPALSDEFDLELRDGRAAALTGADGREWEVDAVVLATGGWFGGGLPGEAPMVEALTGAPLWVDSAPLPGDETLYPPDFLGETPWEDHRLFRAGVQIDRSARLLDRDAEPFENVFAAGRMLAGFNPFHDGCSFGVCLATGSAAAGEAARFANASETIPDATPEPP